MEDLEEVVLVVVVLKDVVAHSVDVKDSADTDVDMDVDTDLTALDLIVVVVVVVVVSANQDIFPMGVDARPLPVHILVQA